MFLHLGGETAVKSSEIVGVFDIEKCTSSKITADFLNTAGKNRRTISVSNEMPKSFIVTKDKVFISNVSNQTLIKRIKKIK